MHPFNKLGLINQLRKIATRDKRSIIRRYIAGSNPDRVPRLGKGKEYLNEYELDQIIIWFANLSFNCTELTNDPSKMVDRGLSSGYNLQDGERGSGDEAGGGGGMGSEDSLESILGQLDAEQHSVRDMQDGSGEE